MIIWDARGDGEIVVATTDQYIVRFLREQFLELHTILLDRRDAQHETHPFGDDVHLTEHRCYEPPHRVIHGVLHWFLNEECGDGLLPWFERSAVHEALVLTTAALAALPLDDDPEAGRIELRGHWQIYNFTAALILLQYHIAWNVGLGIEGLCGYDVEHGEQYNAQRAFYIINWLRIQAADIDELMAEPAATGDPRLTEDAAAG